MNFFTSLYRKMFPLVLHGTRYPWTATVDGDDIVVTGQGATWFGGSNDPQDTPTWAGETASGLNTISNPDFYGCSLPMDYGGLFSEIHNPCQGSPLKKLPWNTQVIVTNRANNEPVTVSLVEDGPAAPPSATAAIDLMRAPFEKIGGDINNGRLLVDYRIINGAKLLNLV